MVSYKLSFEKPHRHYLAIEVSFPVSEKIEKIHLSRWRPGRYELGNFAKNVRDFQVVNEHGVRLHAQKIEKDVWHVETENSQKLTVRYAYYANEINAGSTYIDDELLYVNPVNCLVYTESCAHLPVEVTWETKSGWQLAVGALSGTSSFQVAHFDALADTPFIYSPRLIKIDLTVNEIRFTLWFNGLTELPPEEIKQHFTAFISRQLADFDSVPTNHYHFLFLISEEKAYHGVEHATSTVITLGPKDDLFENTYADLLGVSSHELYHVWNIKEIRPSDLLPYDFKRENYSKLGWVYEGITTYLGDWYLLSSGIFELEHYFYEFESQFQRHLDNLGRHHYAVADSSFDTWLDGYVQGAPGRKVSIYFEGCLLAFLLDVEIRKSTSNTQSISDFMSALHRYCKTNQCGYDESIIRSLLGNWLSEAQIHAFFQLVHQPSDYFPNLKNALSYLGLEYQLEPATDWKAAYLGMKVVMKGNKGWIAQILDGSTADIGGLGEEDEIESIQGKPVSDFDFYEQETELEFVVYRKGRKLTRTISPNKETGFQKITLQKSPNMDAFQRTNLSFWSEKTQI
jgi:predicted metalloprotease with PDZ domain